MPIYLIEKKTEVYYTIHSLAFLILFNHIDTSLSEHFDILLSEMPDVKIYLLTSLLRPLQAVLSNAITDILGTTLGPIIGSNGLLPRLVRPYYDERM